MFKNTTAVCRLIVAVFCLGLMGPYAPIKAEPPPKFAAYRVQAAAIAPQAETALANGAPFDTSLNARSYSNVYIEAPADAVRLTVTVSNGSGDLDLYMKYGAPLQGGTVAELDADTHFISDGPTASEQIVVTPADTPPLQQGKWYIAVLNLNAQPTSFTITATYEVALEPTLHELTLEVTPDRVAPGDPFTWTYAITPGTVEGRVDVVAAVMLPGGALLFFTENGLSPEPGVFQWGMDLSNQSAGTILHEFPFPSSVPEGDYGFYAVLVREGNVILDDRTWVSNLSGVPVRFFHRSPDQDWFMTHEGVPNDFVKTFSEDEGRIRVDETWAYAANGLHVSFVNADFAGDQPIPQPAFHGVASPYRPDYYHFDTTKQDAAALHGPAQATGRYALWDGELEVLVYDGIVFGFHNDGLAAVVAGPPAGMTPSDVSGTASLQSPPGLEFQSSQALAPAKRAYLFSLASALAGAALSQIPGAEPVWNACLSGFQTGTPTEADLQCLQGALGGLVNGAAAGFHAASWSNWLSAAWSGLKAHVGTSGKDAGQITSRDHKTGCAASVKPASVKAPGAVEYRLDVYSRLRDQVTSVPIRSDGGWATAWQDTMSLIGLNQGADFHWTFQKAISQDEPEAIKSVRMTAYSGTASICNRGVALDVRKPVPPLVTLKVESKTARAPAMFLCRTNVSGGVKPFTHTWSDGLTGQWGVANRFYTILEPGTYAIGVSVTDANGDYDYDSIQVIVTPPEVRLTFIQAATKIEIGGSGTWHVNASGGTPPYSYAYAFSDGPSGGGDLFSRWFDTPGTRTVTVTATDSGAPPSTATVTSSVWVPAPEPKPCAPPDCCPEKPQVCGPHCIPAGAVCCNWGTGGYCAPSETCCGSGCCIAGDYCCPDQAGCCKVGDHCCTGGGCCPAAAPKCCYPGCCPETSTCCGSGCCPPGSFCCADKTGCCPNGYECLPGGKCRPIGIGAMADFTEYQYIESQYPKTESPWMDSLE